MGAAMKIKKQCGVHHQRLGERELRGRRPFEPN
jgi:hypothetical protein